MTQENSLMGLSLKIDEKFIMNTAKDIIQAGVIAALGDKDAIIKSVIESILDKQVDENGNPPRYSSDSKYSLLQVFVNKAVKETAKEAVREIVEENRDEFKKLLKKHLSSAKSLDEFTKSFVDGTINSLEDKWRSTINVTIAKPKE